MKILWVPQVSSMSSDGELLLEKDSNIAFMLNLLKSEFGELNAIDIAFEYDNDVQALIKVLPKDARRIRVFSDQSRSFTSAYVERANFNVEFFRQLITTEQYDVIFVNDPTKATNFRIMLNTIMPVPKAKIISYNHWLAFNNMKFIEFSQIEGMLNSDLCLLNSEYAIGQVEKFCNEHFIEAPTMGKLQPSFNHEYRHITGKYFTDVTGIVYNHRLSSDPYYMFAFNCLVNVINNVERIVGSKHMPTVYFTNPSGKKFDLKKYNACFEQISLKTQDEYYKFLESEAVQIHLNTFFSSKGMWSMSTVEAAITDNICLLPYMYGYKEIFEDNYEGYCMNSVSMAAKLAEIIQMPYRQLKYKQYKDKILKSHSNLEVGKNLNKILEYVVGGC